MKTTARTGLILIVLAAISWTIEKIYYGGRLDASNIIQESFFLPLGFILMAAGLLALAVAGVLLLHDWWRTKRQITNGTS